MKNANVFIDVDLTIVDEKGRMYDGVLAGLNRLREAGCHLFLWSTVGVDYARSTAERLGLSDYFEGYASKPDIIIDDMPSTTEPVESFNYHASKSWESMADEIIRKHVD